MPVRSLRIALVTAATAAALVGGCSSSDDTSGSAGSATATSCSADNRKDIYAAGMTKTAGTITVKLVDANPGPPSKGMNELTLELSDSGKPLDGATVTLTPKMPDHGHGSAVTPVVTPSGNGRYAVAKVYLAMAGLWQLVVDVQPTPGAPLQETAFQFCLDG
jgi:hypothetical protein